MKLQTHGSTLNIVSDSVIQVTAYKVKEESIN